MICIRSLRRQLLAVRLAQVEVAEHRGRVVGHAGDDLRVLGLELPHQDLLAGLRPAEFLDVLRVHAREPVLALEPGLSERCHADHAGGANDPVWQACRARQRVRSATGTARDAELLEAEVIGERGHVVDLVDDAPARPAGRPSVPGPVVRDEEDPGSPVDALVRPALEPAPGVPCNTSTGKSPGSPHSAYASVRPSGVSNVSKGSPTAGRSINPVSAADPQVDLRVAPVLVARGEALPRTRPRCRFVALTRRTLPSRQCAAAIRCHARSSFLPTAFGTTHTGRGSSGPPPTRPHHTPQRPDASPCPTGIRAYSWIVQRDRSSVGSTWVPL